MRILKKKELQNLKSKTNKQHTPSQSEITDFSYLNNINFDSSDEDSLFGSPRNIYTVRALNSSALNSQENSCCSSDSEISAVEPAAINPNISNSSTYSLTDLSPNATSPYKWTPCSTPLNRLPTPVSNKFNSLQNIDILHLGINKNEKINLNDEQDMPSPIFTPPPQLFEKGKNISNDFSIYSVDSLYNIKKSSSRSSTPISIYSKSSNSLQSDFPVNIIQIHCSNKEIYPNTQKYFSIFYKKLVACKASLSIDDDTFNEIYALLCIINESSKPLNKSSSSTLIRKELSTILDKQRALYSIKEKLNCILKSAPEGIERDTIEDLIKTTEALHSSFVNYYNYVNKSYSPPEHVSFANKKDIKFFPLQKKNNNIKVDETENAESFSLYYSLDALYSSENSIYSTPKNSPRPMFDDKSEELNSNPYIDHSNPSEIIKPSLLGSPVINIGYLSKTLKSAEKYSFLDKTIAENARSLLAMALQSNNVEDRVTTLKTLKSLFESASPDISNQTHKSSRNKLTQFVNDIDLICNCFYKEEEFKKIAPSINGLIKIFNSMLKDIKNMSKLYSEVPKLINLFSKNKVLTSIQINDIMSDKQKTDLKIKSVDERKKICQLMVTLLTELIDTIDILTPERIQSLKLAIYKAQKQIKPYPLSKEIYKDSPLYNKSDEDLCAENSSLIQRRIENNSLLNNIIYYTSNLVELDIYNNLQVIDNAAVSLICKFSFISRKVSDILNNILDIIDK